MTISTPVSTLGIRGTTGLVEVGPSGTGGAASDNIKLYPDADGHVGRIEIHGRDGSALGVLTRGASGFAIRGGAGVRPSAVALRISPQQVARDQAFVRQTHQTQSTGRSIVVQRRLRQPSAPNPQQLRPQQLRPQQSPSLPRPGQPNRNELKQTPRTQTPAAPGAQPKQRRLQQQQRSRTPQLQPGRPAQLPQAPVLQPRRPTLQPQGPRPAQRFAVPPGRKPVPAPAQKKRRPQ